MRADLRHGGGAADFGLEPADIFLPMCHADDLSGAAGLSGQHTDFGTTACRGGVVKR